MKRYLWGFALAATAATAVTLRVYQVDVSAGNARCPGLPQRGRRRSAGNL